MRSRASLGSPPRATPPPARSSAAGEVVGRLLLGEGTCAADPCPAWLSGFSLEVAELRPLPAAAAGALAWPLETAAGPAGDATGAGGALLSTPLGALPGIHRGIHRLSAVQDRPAPGIWVDGALRLPAAGLILGASLELAEDPALGAAGSPPLHADLRPEGAVTGVLDRHTGALRLAPIVSRNWPLATELRDLQGTCEPRGAD